MSNEKVNKDLFAKFLNKYSVSKTMRFSLIPIGKTLQHLLEDWEKHRDEERFLNYPEAKRIIDEFIKKYVSDRLLSISQKRSVDFSELVKAADTLDLSDKKNADKFKKTQEKIRKAITKEFPKEEWTKMLGKNLYGKDGYLSTQSLNADDVKIMSTFDKFATYFVNYEQSRANLFSYEEKSTAIAYRIVNDNFMKYYQNSAILRLIKEECIEVYAEARENYPDLEDYCEASGYIGVLEQSQIDEYNKAIGEVNRLMNLYQQQLKDTDNVNSKLKNRRNTKLVTLFNQIMGYSAKKVVIEAFSEDTEVYEAINEFAKVMSSTAEGILADIVNGKSEYEWEKICINDYETLAVCLGVKWNYISNALWNYTENKYRNAGKKINPDKLDDEIKSMQCTVKDLQDAIDYKCSIDDEESKNKVNVIDIFDVIGEAVDKIRISLEGYREYFAQENKLPLKEADVSPIKEYLDSCLNVFRLLKLFAATEHINAGNSDLYANIATLDEISDRLVRLYNKVRNYVTMKPSDARKMHLMFNYPEFCNGFASTKLDSYASFILRKDGKYYLGTLNKENKSGLNFESDNNDNYEMMIYNQASAVKKFIPKSSIQLKDVKAHFVVSDDDYLVRTESFAVPFKITKSDYDLYFTEYEGKKKFQKDYLSSTNDYEGYKAALNQWMEFCVRFLESYKSTKNFDLSDVKPVEKYEYLSDFYTDLDTILYSLEFSKVSCEAINKMVDDNVIYLFQIYNKDFSENSKGTKNLHTLYWEQIFSEENRQNKVIKLNGGAELFFRPASIEKPIVHKQGSVLLNRHYEVKIDEENTIMESLPEDVYNNWYKHLNGIGNVTLTERDLQYKNVIKYSEAHYEIVKDRRFTKAHYEFHVPFTLNYSAIGHGYLNSDVLECLQNNPDVNIIGIDRGERNLLAYSVINQKGKIVAQGSFNTVGKDNVNYKDKLQQKEYDRQEARKNWKTIGNIKDLKSGYLSQVVHELAKLMIEYNAIIVMEDLNVGFKRGRMKVERQVYQKFEKALIDKLNYLVVTKNEDEMTEPGGVLNAYQLTEAFTSFNKMGKHNGFLFYVPAGYTSKIDPTTGFVDVFNYTKLSSAVNRKQFFKAFNDIVYDTDRDLFRFSFDYKNFAVFQQLSRTKWDVYTNGEKYHWDKKLEKQVLVYVNEAMKECLAKVGIIEYDNLYQRIMDISDEHSNAAFWGELLYVFKITMQLRSSSLDSKNESETVDKIISPVLNADNVFFESNGNCLSEVPADADTNGAYHIAMKGRVLLDKINKLVPDKKGTLKMGSTKVTNEDWFKFMQG